MKRCHSLALALGLVFVSGSFAQYPVLDAIADKVIHRYQQASCGQLWEKRGQPKSQKEQDALAVLHNDPQRRQAFLDKVAGPIANKMFECGMIP
jgi:hypothetical protein